MPPKDYLAYFWTEDQHMKIFLNERIIELTNAQPTVNSDEQMVVFTSGHALVTSVNEFIRNGKVRRLIISDPSFNEQEMESLDLSSEHVGNEVSPVIGALLRCFDYIPAAGGVVRFGENSWLFIFRNGKWDLPKGKLEKKDKDHKGFVFTIMNAALREIREETGLKTLKVIARLPGTWHIFTHKRKVFLKHTYWFLLEGSGDERLVPQSSEGIDDVRWIDGDKLSSVLDNTYHSLKDMLTPLIRKLVDHRQEI